MSTSDKKDPIVISPETAAAIGKPILDVIRNDPRFKDPILIASGQDCRAPTQEDVRRMREQLQQNALQTGLPSSYGQNDMAAIICSLVNERNSETGTASLIRWPHQNDQSTGRLDHFMVLQGDIADSSFTPLSNFALFSRIPQNLLNPATIPGTTSDWRAFVIYHEAGHYLHGPPEIPSDSGDSIIGRREYQGELTGHQLYRTAYENGVVSDPEVPAANSSARILRAMISGQPTLLSHSLAGYALSSSAGAATEVTAENFQEASKSGGNTIRRVYAEIGRVHLSENAQLEARISSLQALIDNGDIPSPIDLKPDANGFIGTLNSLPAEEQKKILDATSIPEHLKDQYEAGYKKSLERAAYGAGLAYLGAHAEEMPNLLYSTTRNMYLAGAFKGNVWEQEFSRMFLLGAERYSNDYFKTNGQVTVDIKEYLKPSPEPAASAPKVTRTAELQPVM